jgi:hypothetical protein
MKNIDRLTALMRGDANFDTKSLSFLASLTRAYPWFQTAQVLYMLNLLRLKDAHFLFELRKTSITTCDRKKLFFLIEKDFFNPRLMELLDKEPDSDLDVFGKFESFFDKPIGDEDNLEEMLISTDYMQLFTEENPTADEKPTESIPLEHQDIIDRFLENEKNSNVKFELKPENTPPPAEIANNSTNYDFSEEDMFSETLAKIYLQQHKYKKALQIFRKLNLVFPEKSSYFAAQIREVERLMNSNLINSK